MFSSKRITWERSDFAIFLSLRNIFRIRVLEKKIFNQT